MVRYRERLRTAAEAVAAIGSGQKVYFGSGCAAPHGLIAALAARHGELRGVDLIHHLTMGDAPYLARGMEESFRLWDCFVAANTREAVNEGRADYVPVHLHEMPRLFRRGVFPLDWALIQVSPPEAAGFCSFGIEVGVTKPAALAVSATSSSRSNRRMPRTLGDSFIHVSKIEAFVEVNRGPRRVHPEPPTEIERAVGRNVAQLIQDGACLQLGLGAIPNAVLEFLGDRRDLGIHTEMITGSALAGPRAERRRHRRARTYVRARSSPASSWARGGCTISRTTTRCSSSIRPITSTIRPPSRATWA